MEEIITFLSSLNRLTIISFFITLFLLVYQIYILKKEIKKRNKKINLPDFNNNKDYGFKKDLGSSEKKEKKNIVYQDFSLNKIFIVIILFLVFLSIFIFNLMKRNNQPTPTTYVINEQKKVFVSPKIKIYNENWEEIKEEEIKNIVPGEKLFIAIEKIDDPNINMARIKINQGQWDNQSITTNFNKEKNVFYREYQLATNEGFLKIEAQLHSTIDGWLGD